jgi:N-acetylglucosaminyldiphosphoundecaprenol N-acetyl-beta-D-mannosaminyltransferase
MNLIWKFGGVNMRETANIMGIDFPKITLAQTMNLLSNVIQQTHPELFQVITVNPEIVMACQHDKQLRTILDDAGLITADGIGIVLASRWNGNGSHLPERVTGYDIMIKLLESGNLKGWSFYLLGADEETSRRASEVISQLYPNVKIVGRHHGFFSQDDEPSIISDIQKNQPDVLIAALGAPFAERWIYKHKTKLKVKVAIGVGGSLDIVSGKVKRAPVFWQRLNLEWLHRLMMRPSTRWRRQLVLPRFAVRALLYKRK